MGDSGAFDPENIGACRWSRQAGYASDRAALNGILWVLRTGAGWADLPERFPSGSTCFRRFSRWVRQGVLRAILEALARDLEDRGKINLSECFIDGTFVVAKKGAAAWERPSGAKVRNSWQWQMAMVFLSPSTWQALPPRNDAGYSDACTSVH